MSKKKAVDKRKFQDRILAITVKLLLIALVAYAILQFNSSYSNEMYLLAVSEDSEGNAQSGSLIRLRLEVEPGTGETFVNLNTVEDIDTQISIINSQKTACRLFDLDCNAYDFYYTFEGSSFVLKGPSASSAIAILTAKTLNKEKIDRKEAVITGSLNSGGVIGNVGGVEQKVNVARKEGFEKVLIPVFSDYNETPEGIEVIRVIDIIEAYNNFDNSDFRLDTHEIDTSSYETRMRSLALDMCARSESIREQIDIASIENSTLSEYLRQAQRSYNSSRQAQNASNYYSMGSFCYNSNINYRIIFLKQQNLSSSELNEMVEELEDDVSIRKTLIKSSSYKEEIETINDFYVYLLLIDRLEESEEMLEEISRGPIEIDIQDIERNSQGQATINLTNVSQEEDNTDREVVYSNALERFYTIDLWERFITHSGREIEFSDERIQEACRRINNELNIKFQLLKNYNINLFDEAVQEQNTQALRPSDKYLCVYEGLELLGRMDTVLNSLGISQQESTVYAQQLLNLTHSRLTLNGNGDFPLIPYIYYEYSGDLLAQGDVASSMLYSNYALSYTGLNIYLVEEDYSEAFTNLLIDNLFSNVWFVVPLLVLLAFLS